MTDTVEKLQRRLRQAEDIIEALKGEEVDAVVTRSSISLLRLRETEEKLRKSEERLRMATKIGKIGTWYLDIQSGNFDMSERCRDIYGLPVEGVVTVGQLLEIVHPEDRSRVQATLAEVTETPVEFENEYRVIHPEGSEHWVSTRCESFPDSEGKLIFNIGMVIDITEKKMQENQLIAFNEILEQRVSKRTAQVESQTKQLRALANRLTRVEHQERKRLAKILHDHIQQLLVAARMQLGSLKRCKQMEQMVDAARNVDSTLQQAIEASRSLALDLSPPALQEGGLSGGLRWLALHMKETNDFTLHLHLDDQAEPDNNDTRILLFESVRELILNTVKHARVSEAEVTMKKNQDDNIELTVNDEGKGFDPNLLKDRPPEEATFGLYSIQERLAHIGGEMKIDSSPGSGTRTTLVIPAR